MEIALTHFLEAAKYSFNIDRKVNYLHALTLKVQLH